MLKDTIATIFALLLASSVTAAEIPEVKSLGDRTAGHLGEIRDSIRSTIRVIKGGKPVTELPNLRFYRYRVKKDDTFWAILSATGQDMDTLISVNGLSSPSDVRPGMTIFIPNMRGVILASRDKRRLHTMSREQRIGIDYVRQANRSDRLDRDYIFVPCGQLTQLERSLFLGTAFLHPLKEGKLSSGFGMRRNPFDHSHSQFHAGIDISCPVRSPVRAARKGTVVFTGYKGGYGKLVIVKHEHGYYTYYGHLHAFRAKVGQVVNAGQIIALSGNTGRTTGPHLHFETRRGNRPVNPGLLLRLP